MTSKISCDHFNHMIIHPLCNNQTILKKITNIAVLCLFVGSAATLCTLFYKFLTASTKKLPFREIEGVCKEAMDFASQALKDNPNVEYKGWTLSPANKDISKLKTLLDEKYYPKLKQVLEESTEGPYTNQAVLEAADEYMKVTYAISVLTLRDYPEFINGLDAGQVKKLKERIPNWKLKKLGENENEKPSFAMALVSQSSYQYRTFFECPALYHDLRGEMMMRENSHYSPHTDGSEENILDFTHNVPEEHAAPFYKEGSMQGQWRSLYNDYCDRVRMYVPESELKYADERFANWTVKDTGVKSFKTVPDTLPT